MAETIVHKESTNINDPAQDLLEIFQALSPEDQQYILRLARQRQKTRQILPDNEEVETQFSGSSACKSKKQLKPVGSEDEQLILGIRNGVLKPRQGI
jgi:hypothetical protein